MTHQLAKVHPLQTDDKRTTTAAKSQTFKLKA